MNISQLIDYLENYEPLKKNIKLWKKINPVEAKYSEYPENIDTNLKNLFVEKGIVNLYSHQRKAFDIAEQKKDLVVVTPTASGKTICYNLPVLNHIINNPEARALYLFPTKALAQDQMHELNNIINTLEADIKTYTFDGDTPANARKAIRSSGHVVITNPDMLHSGILPHHTIWIKLFENLKYIVIDEVHSYKGVFGSHLANLIRRLRRICKFYGSNPQFILCSATILNPKEHAENLIERPVHLIDNNGAPSGEKHYLIYNPPVVNEQLGIRSSAVKEAAKFGSFILKNNIATIIFARSRMRVEIISTYLKEKCKSAKLASYRGGYLPNERRKIEKGLRNKEILGVVSTNALELGIDIGMLDAVITTGYPGSISSMQQQFGRAGRRGEASLSVMIATSSPLDQYIANNPEFVIDSNPECACINPDNILILMDHLKCAAFELPFSEDERFAKHLSTTKEMLEYLEEMGILKKAENKYHWMNQIYPATEISLRTAASENFVIIDKTDKTTVIGEVDYHSAPTLIHDDAIYIHMGKQYYIDKLDWERRTAYCHEVDTEYYTDADSKKDLHVLEQIETKDFNIAALSKGEINIREKATLFKKIRFNTHENLGWGKIDLPESEMHTTATWIDFDDEKLYNIAGKETAGDILYSISYIFQNLVPIFTLADIMDIHTLSQSRADHSGKPAIYIYDSTPGGVGLSDRVFTLLPTISNEAINVISKCNCANGCPGCIGPLVSDDSNLKTYIIEVLKEFCDEPERQTKYLH